MKMYFSACTRSDDATATVQKGKIVELSIGDYKEMSVATRKDSIDKFLCCLRNVYDMLIRHNRKGFDKMMEEIRCNDSELYYYGQYMLHEYEERAKESAEEDEDKND